MRSWRVDVTTARSSVYDIRFHDAHEFAIKVPYGRERRPLPARSTGPRPAPSPRHAHRGRAENSRGELGRGPGIAAGGARDETECGCRCEPVVAHRPAFPDVATGRSGPAGSRVGQERIRLVSRRPEPTPEPGRNHSSADPSATSLHARFRRSAACGLSDADRRVVTVRSQPADMCVIACPRGLEPYVHAGDAGRIAIAVATYDRHAPMARRAGIPSLYCKLLLCRRLVNQPSK